MVLNFCIPEGPNNFFMFEHEQKGVINKYQNMSQLLSVHNNIHKIDFG